MFESLSSLVNPQSKRSSSPRSPTPAITTRASSSSSSTFYPAPINTKMSGQMPYNTQMGSSKSSSRRTSLSPTTTSTSTSNYSASRQQSMSSTSSSPSQAQNLLSKMASQGAVSPPGSRLMTPAMTPFPSPAEEGAPFPGGVLGLSSTSTSRPGTERSQAGYISFPDFEQFRKSFEACNMTAADDSRQQKS